MSKLPPRSTPFTFATWNVHGCATRKRPFEPAAVADALSEVDADVIALQETSALDGADGHDHVADIAALLGMHAVYGPNVRGHDGRYRYGNALLTRWPVVESTNVDLSVAGVEPRGALVAYLETPDHGPILRVASIHLGLSARERAAQAKLFVDTVVRAPDAPPLVVGGDMNDWYSGADTRAVRAHLRDSGRFATYPAFCPVFRLDHIYVDPAIEVETCTRLNSSRIRSASDHLPLVAHVRVAPAALAPYAEEARLTSASASSAGSSAGSSAAWAPRTLAPQRKAG